MRRREFITLVGVAAATWPLIAHAQQPAMPVVGWLNSGGPAGNSLFMSLASAFRDGLKDAGYVEGQMRRDEVCQVKCTTRGGNKCQDTIIGGV